MENSQDFTLGFLLGAITIMVGYAIGKRLKSNLNNRQRFFIWAVVVVIHAWLNLGPLHISKVYVIPSVIFFLSIFYLDFDNPEVTPQAGP